MSAMVVSHLHTTWMVLFNVYYCCETAGFSWVYEMNVSNNSLSMNVFQMWGIAFIPDKVKPDIDRESDTKTYSWGETV
jgi:uncharacterized protein (DUF486 family)